MARRASFGHVFQPTGRNNWYLRFDWDGRRITRLAGTTRTVAERNRTRVHSLLLDGKPVEEVLAEVFNDVNGSRLTFAELSELYLRAAPQFKKASTVAGDKKRIAVLKKAPWASKLLCRLRREEINRWVTERTAGGASGATANRDVCLASAIVGWAIERGMCEDNPFRKVARLSERGRKRETYLTAGEARLLLSKAPEVIRPVLLCALTTGMRRGEILSLDWSDVDLEKGVLLVQPEREKAGRGRPVPMVAELKACVKELESRRVRRMDGKEPLFVRPNGERWDESSLRQAFLAARNGCADLPAEKRASLRFHDLRHTAASLMVTAGVPLYSVGKVLGHSTPQTTARYAHLAPEAERAAIEKLGQVLAPPAAQAATGGA
jgi:integrase